MTYRNSYQLSQEISHAFVTIDKPTQTELRNRKKRLRKISEIYGKQ
jgi:hypothetical protein